MPIEGRGDTPHTTFAIAEFGLLLGCIFVQAVGRISHDGMKAVVLLLFQPVEAISIEERRPPEAYRFPPFLCVGKLILNTSVNPQRD